MPRRAAKKNERWPKILLLGVATLFVLVLCALWIGQAWLNRYLRSQEFRAAIESRASASLRAKVEIAPFRFEGTQFFSENFSAKGAESAAFSALKVDAIRGELGLPSIFRVLLGERRWAVDHVEIQKLLLEFYPDRIGMDLPPAKELGEMGNISSLLVRDVTIGWPAGGVRGASIRASVDAGAWKIESSGGSVTQLGMPSLEISHAKILYKKPSIFVQEARLTHEDGEVTATGEISPGSRADMRFEARNLNITPFLPEDWRARLHGRLSGDTRVIYPLGPEAASPPKFSGKFQLHQGVIEAFPVLTKLAEFTRTDQFRRIQIHTLDAEYQYEGDTLRVDHIVMESKQLIVLRGSFTVTNGMVDGVFDVGITPGPLRWLPGSQEKVFNTANGGYVWTKMRIVGPSDAIQEDLSPRLIAAAREATAEGLKGTASQAVDTTVDTVKKGVDSVFDSLFGK